VLLDLSLNHLFFERAGSVGSPTREGSGTLLFGFRKSASWKRAIFSTAHRMKYGDRYPLSPSEGSALERKKDVRRSTRLSRQIPIVITSLDPAHSFSGKYETTVVNAHGCGVILPERLEKETPVVVEVISNGQSRQAKVVLAISVVEGVSWLLGFEFDSPSGIFWRIENPPADWWRI
jgi:hypothetical protein